MVRPEGRGFLVLFKDGECRVTPRFHFFVSEVNQGKEKAGWIEDSFLWTQEWKGPPFIFCEILNIMWGVVMCRICSCRLV